MSGEKILRYESLKMPLSQRPFKQIEGETYIRSLTLIPKVDNEKATAENGIDTEVITSASRCINFIDDYANMTYKTVIGVFWKTVDF